MKLDLQVQSKVQSPGTANQDFEVFIQEWNEGREAKVALFSPRFHRESKPLLSGSDQTSSPLHRSLLTGLSLEEPIFIAFFLPALVNTGTPAMKV